MPIDRSPPPRAPLRVAAAQAQPEPGNVPANVAKVVRLVEAAADREARVVVLPEKFLSGYEPELVASDPGRYAIADGDRRLDPILEACARRRVAAIVGAATRDGDRLRISSIVCGPDGKVAARYDKQHLFSPEKRVFSPGDAGCAVVVDGWLLGLAVCYDSAFPEHARAAATSGCHAYLVSALFGIGNGRHESRVWLPARALDNTMYALLSNHVGTTGGWHACGGSAVWGPSGDLLAEASAAEEGLAVADLDPAVLEDVRRRETMLSDLGARADAGPGRYTFHPLAVGER